jgi:hypothetical protein
MEKLITCKFIITLITIVLLNFNTDSIYGQNTVSTAEGSTGLTVGQVAYVLKKGNGLYLNKGVQEVYTKNILRLVPMFEI